MVLRKATSIHEVALKAGFSIATVSNVLNNKGRISAKTRKKVLAVAQELGYSPNAFGRQLRIRHSETIGLLFYPTCAQLFLNVYYAPIMAGVEECLEKHNYDLLLSSYQRSAQETKGLPNFIQNGKADGVVLLGNFPKPTVSKLADSGIPLLLLDTHMEGISADSITTDGFSAGALIARHLAGFGHQRMAFIGYEKEDYNANDRRRGFLQALDELGLSHSKSQIRARISDTDRFAEVAKAMAEKRRPTAFFAENDTLAFQVVQFLQQQGWKVPKDVSVVGFDNSRDALASKPQLTTAGIDQQVMGRIGAEAIVSRIQNPSSPYRSFRLPVTLDERDSVAPPPA